MRCAQQYQRSIKDHCLIASAFVVWSFSPAAGTRATALVPMNGGILTCAPRDMYLRCSEDGLRRG